MSYPTRSWSILPASQCLMGKLKVTVAECAEEWKDGQVLVCSRDMFNGKNPTLMFLNSCGDMGVKVGSSNSIHHDQTFRRLGEVTILAVVTYKTVDGTVQYDVQEDVEGTFDLNTKAPMAVFK